MTLMKCAVTQTLLTLTLLTAMTAHAQVVPLVLPPPLWPLSSVPRPMARVEAPKAMAASEVSRGQGTDVRFWLLAAALNTAMMLDTKSTFDVKRRCVRCVGGRGGF